MNQRGITLYLHVHQPYRVRQYSIFDTSIDHNYFYDSSDSNYNNQKIFQKVADKPLYYQDAGCRIPAFARFHFPQKQPQKQPRRARHFQFAVAAVQAYKGVPDTIIC